MVLKVSKTLELSKLSRKLCLKFSGASFNQKNVSAYWLLNFLSLFMYLLTAKLAEKSLASARIFFIFLKNVQKQTWGILFNIKFSPQSIDWKSSYLLKQVLALFWNLINLLFAHNSVKGVRVTKILKDIMLERAGAR